MVLDSYCCVSTAVLPWCVLPHVTQVRDGRGAGPAADAPRRGARIQRLHLLRLRDGAQQQGRVQGSGGGGMGGQYSRYAVWSVQLVRAVHVRAGTSACHITILCCVTAFGDRAVQQYRAAQRYGS